MIHLSVYRSCIHMSLLYHVMGKNGSLRRMSTITGGKPSLTMAKAMPREYFEMPNDVLMSLAANNDPEAHRERLSREIMALDDVDWDTAQVQLAKMANANKAGMFTATLPYKVGILSALTAGIASIPLCFHLPTALWFNTHYVTTEVAAPEDLETWLEVGSWTWNWMEPRIHNLYQFLCLL